MTESIQTDNLPNITRKTRTSLRRTIRALLFFTLMAGGLAAGVFAYYYGASRTVRDTVNILVTRHDIPEKAFPGGDQVNILLMGKDVDRDRHGRIIHTRGRTDTMMLAHIDFRNRMVNILSIPRDTLVHIPGYRGKRRISYANALGGPDLARKTIAEFLGVAPDYYVLVNFEGFEKAIDTLGGLEVEVDKQLDYDDNWGNLHIHLKPGRQMLDGNQAMGFVRYRHSNNGGGDSDLVRIGRQQELMKAAQAKLASPQVMFRVPEVLDRIRNEMLGDLTPAQMICLARFIHSLQLDSGIRLETLPALDGGGIFVRADPNATQTLVSQMFFDNQQ